MTTRGLTLIDGVAPTFATLQTITASPGSLLHCTERGSTYVVQASGYVALDGDVNLSDGLIGALQ